MYWLTSAPFSNKTLTTSTCPVYIYTKSIIKGLKTLFANRFNANAQKYLWCIMKSSFFIKATILNVGALIQKKFDNVQMAILILTLFVFLKKNNNNKQWILIIDIHVKQNEANSCDFYRAHRLWLLSQQATWQSPNDLPRYYFFKKKKMRTRRKNAKNKHFLTWEATWRGYLS